MNSVPVCIPVSIKRDKRNKIHSSPSKMSYLNYLITDYEGLLL